MTGDNFTEQYLRNAAADQVQGDFTPFNKNDIGKVKRYVKGMLGRLSDNKRINVEADFSSYSSGFASYINVKISKKDKSDTIVEKNGSRTTEKKDARFCSIFRCLHPIGILVKAIGGTTTRTANLRVGVLIF